jgi:hypothetical protein
MKNNIRAFVALAYLIAALPLLSSAQLSEGGTPPGFRYAPAAGLPVIKMPAVNVDSMLEEDSVDQIFKGHPYRFGYNHLVYYKPENSGTWTNLPNGDRIWQLDVKTPGAYSVNLGFSGFHLPAGAKLFVYSKDGSQVLGGFTSANNTPDKFFGTELIHGDEAVLEYYEPAGALGQSSFILFRITQGYKNVVHDLKSGIGFGTAGTCIHNINCPQYYDYATQKRAVVCVVVEGNSFCSGSLINDALNDGTPYILTANHCSPNTPADGTWIFRFNWEAPGCEDPGTDPAFESITGATQIAKSGISDFNLVKMDATPPCSFHAFYMGWNRGLTPATSVTDIHHPNADIKKCSQANNPVTATSYDAGNGPAEVWQIGIWTDGATEPGSSGSPLLDQNKRIVGQLYGGPSDCDVAAYNLHDYFGRFSVSWDSGSTTQTRLKDWLDPNNSGAITNDGYDPCPPVDTVDIELNAVLSPVNGSCVAAVNPSVVVTNIGTVSVSTITVNYYVDSASDSTYVWTGTLAPGASTTINMPPLPVIPGIHSFYANVNLPAGMVDQNLYNDSIITAFTEFEQTTVPVPLVEGFEEGFFPPTNWTLTTPPSGTTWTLTSRFGGFGLSASSAEVNEFAPATSTAGETPSLISPPVSMVNAPNPSFLKFDVAYAPYEASTDSLAILESTNCGATWDLIYKKGGDSLATAPNASDTFLPLPSQWRKDSINISNLIGQSDVLFEFEVISGWGNAMYIDNIDIADTNASVGVLPVTDNMQVHVFPNPFSQNFNLQLSLDAAQNITAGVYSVDGKKLITVLDNQKSDAGTHLLEINTNQLSNGVYILKVNERAFKLEKMK